MKPTIRVERREVEGDSPGWQWCTLRACVLLHAQMRAVVSFQASDLLQAKSSYFFNLVPLLDPSIRVSLFLVFDRVASVSLAYKLVTLLRSGVYGVSMKTRVYRL